MAEQTQPILPRGALVGGEVKVEASAERGENALVPPIVVLGPMGAGRRHFAKLIAENTGVMPRDATPIGTILQSVLTSAIIGEDADPNGWGNALRADLTKLARMKDEPGGSIVAFYDMHQTGYLIPELWPSARVVAVHRSCEDTVASLLRLGRLGYDDPVLSRYISRYPRNFMRALALYWADSIDDLLTIRNKLRDKYLQVSYEDIVARPREVIRQVAEFANVQLAPPVSSEKNTSDPESRVRGMLALEAVADEKAGRGATLPYDRLSQGLRDRINQLSAILGYPEIGSAQRRYASRVKVTTFKSPGSTAEARFTTERYIHAPKRLVDRTQSDHDQRLADLFDRHVARRIRECSEADMELQLAPEIDVALVDGSQEWSIDFVRQSVTPARALARYAVLTQGIVLLAIRAGITDVETEFMQGRLIILSQDVECLASDGDAMRIARVLGKVL